MIKLVALDPYGHWNFKPAAEDMWAFLSRFRRECDDRCACRSIRPVEDAAGATVDDEPIRGSVAYARPG